MKDEKEELATLEGTRAILGEEPQNPTAKQGGLRRMRDDGRGRGQRITGRGKSACGFPGKCLETETPPSVF